MRNKRGSSIALGLAGLLFLFASIAGFLNANVVNGPRFADHINAMRTDPELAAQIGAQISAALVDAQPDLVAIAPALQPAAAAVVASSAFDGVFTQAVAAFHSALTEEG
ncbi:MAG: hypothetical protein R2687_09990, partial [Candidatus Nanopelagicales bacterium]